jgi:hypothetical protein
MATLNGLAHPSPPHLPLEARTRLLSIGAPRFELGTSSPPDHFGTVARVAATCREVACEQGDFGDGAKFSRSLRKWVSRRLCPERDRGGGA